MGIEDDLFSMFRHLDLGSGGIDGVLKTLMKNVQIGTLKQLRKEIDRQIEALSGVKAGLDPYEILGVSQSATRPDIEKAYRKRSFENHPDRGGSDEEMMKVNAAYQAIKKIRGWK